MSIQDSDISWPMLRRIVHECLGTAAELKEVAPLDGGSINTTLRLTTAAGDTVVLKISPHRVNRAYLTEAYQLNVLREVGVPVPRVFASKLGSLDDPVSYLMMEYVEGVDLHTARSRTTPEEYDRLQAHLADVMLALHSCTHDCYTRLTEADRCEFPNWPAFYHDLYDPQWHACEKLAAIPVKVRKTIGRVHERLGHLLDNDDRPRLLHFDAWSSNILCRAGADGKWYVVALLDPNCKYGHAEAELAYMDYFRTTTPAFLRAYQQARKLSPEYHRHRKCVYQLYELINHVSAFGTEYVKPLLAHVDKVSALV
ncbi:MAG TPA: fructosamine kinase family protein [Tepidisphaeraceae bacterium]|nr:fructosamine kinase family protein [Tepidisphaeraceae bacterium]